MKLHAVWVWYICVNFRHHDMFLYTFAREKVRQIYCHYRMRRTCEQSNAGSSFYLLVTVYASHWSTLSLTKDTYHSFSHVFLWTLVVVSSCLSELVVAFFTAGLTLMHSLSSDILWLHDSSTFSTHPVVVAVKTLWWNNNMYTSTKETSGRVALLHLYFHGGEHSSTLWLKWPHLMFSLKFKPLS